MRKSQSPFPLEQITKIESSVVYLVYRSLFVSTDVLQCVFSSSIAVVFVLHGSRKRSPRIYILCCHHFILRDCICNRLSHSLFVRQSLLYPSFGAPVGLCFMIVAFSGYLHLYICCFAALFRCTAVGHRFN